MHSIVPLILLFIPILADICPAGYSCMGNVIMPCPSGTYNNIGDGSDGICQPCPAGYYCPGQSIKLPCPESTPYSYEGSTSGCSASCPAGTSCSRGLPTPCTLGYIPSVDKLSCRACRAGYYCPNHITEIVCPAGTYSSIAQAYCNVCGLGKYCPSTTGSEISCPSGYYSLGKQTSCTICPKGVFCPTTDKDPQRCEEGYYSPYVGSTSCSEIPAGYYSNNYADLYPCADGYYSLGHASACRICPAGFECPNKNVLPSICPAGRYSTGGFRLCKICPTGYYCAKLHVSPTACAAPNYSIIGSLRCYPCPLGYYCTSNFPEPCQSGQYSLLSTTCSNSGAGYMAHTTTEAPIACPTGSYSLALWTTCVECPIGTKCPTNNAVPIACLASNFEYSSGQQIACTATPTGYQYINPSVHPIRCLPGTYQTSDKSKCIASVQGYITPNPAAAPTQCALGTFSPVGHAWCQNCPYGYYCPTRSSESMYVCLLGQHSAEASTAGCINCPAGSSCPTLNSANNYQCQAGTYAALKDSVCQLCPSGYQCSSVGMSAPALCEAGTFATEGWWYGACTTCALGKQCPFRFLSFEEDCDYGLYTPAISQTSCKPCPLGSHCENREAAIACASNEYSMLGDPLCRKCPGGYKCSSSASPGIPEPCLRGYFSDEGANNCVICPAGSYCPRSSIFPIPCPPGYYSGSTGSTICTHCAIGYYSGYNSSSCTILDSGYEAIYHGAPVVPCSKGYYSLHTTRGWSCLPCTPGFTCENKANTFAQLTACPSGYYCNTVEGPTILVSGIHPCPPGTYAKTSVTEAYHIYGSCQDCDAGYYCLGGNAAKQICPDGFYCPARTRFMHEFPCPAGTQSKVATLRDTLANSCETCPSGVVCYEGTVTPFSCPPEYTCGLGTAYLSLSLRCNQGQYYFSSGCMACDAGSFCPYGVFLPIKCPPGTYTDDGNSYRKEDCHLCPQGYACPYFGSGSSAKVPCKLGFSCPEGTTMPDQIPLLTGQFEDSFDNTIKDCPDGKACYEGSYTESIEDCPIGYYCKGGLIKKAEAGTYINIRGAADSTDSDICPAGFYCPEGTILPERECFEGYFCRDGAKTGDSEPCPEGSWSNKRGLKDSSECTQCSKGYYCPIASKYQFQCPIGTYKNTLGGGMSACLPCQGGYKCPTEGLIDPIQCGKGYYSMIRSTKCFECPKGYSCGSDTTDFSAMTKCTVGNWCDVMTGIEPGCPVGHYCEVGTLVPQPCPAGTYRDVVGSGSSAQCYTTPSGQYSHMRATVPEGLCSPGFFCLDNSFNSMQSPCAGGSKRIVPGAKSQDDCSECPIGYYCPEATAVPVICPQGYYCTINKSAPDLCNAGTYGADVGLTKIGDCTKCPEGRYCSQQGLPSPDGMCDQGYFCPLGSDKSNQELCGAGGYCDAGSVTRQSCPPGRYNSDTGGRDLYACRFCDPGKSCSGSAAIAPTGGCDEGFYCPRGSKTPKEMACEPGYYCPANSSDPVPCSVGFYNPYYQQTACLKCPPGFYCDTVANKNIFVDCPVGNYCPEQSTSPIPCSIGTYNPNKFMKSSADCLPCPAGYYCASVGLSAASGKCASGYWCKSGATEAAPGSQNANYGPCRAGRYCLQGFISEVECPQGYYQDLSTQSECKECPTKQYCRISGLSLPEGTCSGGYICSTTKTKTPMPYNSFCSAGYYCPAGTLLAIECAAGYYQPNERQSECILCPSGYYCPATGSGISTKTDCPAGSYCPAGSSNFIKCLAGTYNPRLNADKIELCLSCDPGKYCNAAGLSAVTGDCSPGYFCVGGSGSANQNQCPAGYYCPQGTSRKLKCPVGYYCPVAGMYDTNVTGAGDAKNYLNKKCPAGYYCLGGTSLAAPSIEATDFGSSCPVGYYCPLGSLYKIPCPPGTYNSLTTRFLSTHCLVCQGGYYCAGYGNSALTTKCDAGYDCTVAPSSTQGYITNNPISAVCPVGHFCTSGNAKQLCSHTAANMYIQLQQGKSSCDSCPAGFYCPDTMSKIMCDPSQEGSNYYCPEATNKVLCPSGYYNVVPGSSNILDCTVCPPGKYCPINPSNKDSKVLPCDSGYVCKGGNTDATYQSTACPIGYYCPSQSSTGIPCPVGRFCPAGSTESILTDNNRKCSDGYYCMSKAEIATPNDGLTGQICPAGYICPSGTESPIACPIGTYNPNTNKYLTTHCLDCPATAYCTEKALVSPKVPCPAGYFCPVNTTSKQQNLCPVGYKCPAGSQAAIICPVKTFQPNEGQEACITCLPGFYCDETGMTTPKLCRVGKYCPENSAAEILCPVGTFNPRTGLTSYTDCEVCLPGYYCQTEGLTTPTNKCNAGYYCIKGAKTPTPTKDATGDLCPLGYYCPLGSHMATPCPPGRYGAAQRLISDSQCTKCVAGYFCPYYGETRKDMQFGTENMKCNAGFVCLEGSRTASPTSLAEDNGRLCNAGYYCPKGTFQDKECGLATYNPDIGQSSCIDCPAGFICNSTALSSVSIKCIVGYYCPAKTIVPLPCPAGTYMPYGGAKVDTECIICPPGKYCVGGNAAPDGLCAEGYACSLGAPQSSPQNIYKFELDSIPGKCPMGYFCPQGSSSPQPCPPGTYQGATGSASCNKCPKGKYCDEYGLTVAVRECAFGYLCILGAKHPRPINEATEGGRLCSPGYYCPVGATRELACKPATYEPRYGSGACQMCPKGYYCVPPDGAENIIDPIICPVSYYCPEGTMIPLVCADGTYGQFEGLENQDQCRQCPSGVYCRNGVIAGECEPGFYCDYGVFAPMDSSKKCPEGHYCLKGTIYPIVCPSGTVRAENGGAKLSDCHDCPDGEFCLPGISISFECPKGYYCPANASKPIECPSGTYNNIKSAMTIAACKPCIAGFNCYESAISNFENYPCEAGAYCIGMANITYCPINKFRNTQKGTSEADCLDCPDGLVCEKVGTINPYPCPPGYICIKGIKTACPGGYYCPVGTATPVPCPEAFYCPKANSSYYKCPIGTFCPNRSETPTLCPSGTVPNGNEKNIDKEGSCKACIEGTYSTENDTACRPCDAGYVCTLGADRPNPTIPSLHNGYVCPKGFYCPERSFKETPCPKGTYRDIDLGKSEEDCFPCPEGTFNLMVAQTQCQTCGSSSIKSVTGLMCDCIGKNRVYQITTKTCICAVSYEPTIKNEDNDGNSSCQPIVYIACKENTVRDASGNCIDIHNCTSECNGGNGTRSTSLGVCICDNSDVLESVCNSLCRGSKPTITVANNMIYSDGFALDLTAVESKILGNLTCSKIGETCRMLSLGLSSDNEFTADYNPTGLIQSMSRDYGTRRKLDSSSALKSPVMCIYIGDSIAFTTSKLHYPKYCRESLINSIKAFDESPFKMLEEKLLAGDDIQNFIYTFYQDGIAVIQDALNISRQTIIAVMGNNKKCPDDSALIQPQTYDILLKIGALQKEDIVVSPNWSMIFGVLIMIVVGVPFIVFIIRLILNKKWYSTQPKRKPYLEENNKYNVESNVDSSTVLSETQSKSFNEFLISKDDPRIVELLTNDERSLKAIRKTEARKLQHEVDPSVFLKIYEDLRECVKQTQEKLINRTAKDSSKINEAFDAVSQIQMLLESKLQAIVKKYSPNANLQFAHNEENAHIEIVNDEDKEEEEAPPVLKHANKDISEQIDLQLQQQDLEDEVLAHATIESMKTKLELNRSDEIAIQEAKLREDLKNADSSTKESILKELQNNQQRFTDGIRLEKKAMEDNIARRLIERKAQRQRMKGKQLEIENERQEQLRAIKIKVDQIKIKEQKELNQIDSEYNAEREKEVENMNLKHEQEWDAVLAKYQGKVAQTKDANKISMYLDTYVNNYAEIRKQMEEQWKAQDEHALLRLQKRKEDKIRQIESKAQEKEEEIGRSFIKELNSNPNEIENFDVPTISPMKCDEKLQKLEILINEKQKIINEINNKLSDDLRKMEDQYLKEEKELMLKDPVEAASEIQKQKDAYNLRREELKAKISSSTKEEKEKMLDEVTEFEKKFKSFKASEAARVNTLINDRRDERRRKLLSMQDAATTEAIKEKEQRIQIIGESEKEISSNILEAQLEAALAAVPPEKREQAIGVILDKLIEQKQINEFSQLLIQQLKEKSMALSNASAGILREKVMELEIMKKQCDKNSPSKVREAQNKIELDYIGKQYSTEMEIHEKYGKRHMLELAAMKEAHILERKAFITQYVKDPFILQLLLASQASLAHELEIYKADMLTKYQQKAKEIENKKLKIELTNKQTELQVRSLEDQENILKAKIEKNERLAEEKLKKETEKKRKEQEQELIKKGISEEEKKKMLLKFNEDLEALNKAQEEERKRQHQLLADKMQEKRTLKEKYIQEREEQIIQIKQETLAPQKIESAVEDNMDLLEFTKSKNEQEKKFFLKVKPITGLKNITKKMETDDGEERVADFYKITSIDGVTTRDDKFDFNKLLSRIKRIESTLGDVADTQFSQLMDGFRTVFQKMDILDEIKQQQEEQK